MTDTDQANDCNANTDSSAGCSDCIYGIPVYQGMCDDCLRVEVELEEWMASALAKTGGT